MTAFDLKLFRVFDEIHRARSVSRAAHSLGVTQPSVSIALARLRRHFGDPLFVRTSEGMQPTPFAAELALRVREGMALLEGAQGHKASFDPARSEQRFRLCLTDISQAVLLPALLNHLKRVAPGIALDIVPIGPDTARMLEAGEASVAIGFMPQLEAGFYQQKLFSQRFVCVVRQDHPRIRQRLSLAQFTAEDHIAVTSSATGHWILDKTLEDARIDRRVTLRLPDFLGLAAIVAATDSIVCVPERLGQVMREAARVKLLAPPMRLPVYQVKQHWHERFHHDAAHRWLRGVVAQLFLE